MQGGFRGLEQGLRKGVRPGEGAVREVAAFLLDHEHFAGVPPTALVSCYNSSSPVGDKGKVGSLQVHVQICQKCQLHAFLSGALPHSQPLRLLAPAQLISCDGKLFKWSITPGHSTMLCSCLVMNSRLTTPSAGGTIVDR